MAKGFEVNLQSSRANTAYSAQMQTAGDIEEQNTFSSIMSQTKNTLENKSFLSSNTSAYQETKRMNQYNNDFTVSQSNTGRKDTVKKEMLQTKKSETKDVANGELSGADRLKEKLKKTLGISENEIDELLASLGFTMMDLFSQDNLTEFVLAKFGSEDVSDALFNEELAGTLTECLNDMQELLSELDLTMLSDMEQPFEGENDVNFEDALRNAKEEETSDISKETLASDDVKVTIESSKEIGHHSTKQESGNGTSQQEGFVDFFASQVDLNSLNEAGQVSDLVTAKEIVTQLVEQIKISINQTNTSMELMLNPENLGKVQLLVSSKNGVLTAQMTVDNQITKEAIESSIHTLKETFAEQGLKVEEVEVTIGNYSSEYDEQRNEEQQQEQKGSKRKLNLDDNELSGRMTTETVVDTEPVNMLGSVSYTA
ncbi:MAG: flagellar hook-length control protein FliK [bacterium]|nr:flagellar hook-length control protein FliK [bacterium]